MKTRILRLEDSRWIIRTKSRAIPKTEVRAIERYLTKVRIPHDVISGRLSIPARVSAKKVWHAVERYYRGSADLLPF